MDLKPIVNTAKASNASLARGINRFHECLEAHILHTEQNFQTLQSDIKDLKEIMKPKGKAKPIAFLSSWQAGWRGATAVFAGLSMTVVVWRGIIALWPSGVEFFKHIATLINTGHP